MFAAGYNDTDPVSCTRFSCYFIFTGKNGWLQNEKYNNIWSRIIFGHTFDIAYQTDVAQNLHLGPAQTKILQKPCTCYDQNMFVVYLNM